MCVFELESSLRVVFSSTVVFVNKFYPSHSSMAKLHPTIAISDAFLAGISLLVAIKMLRGGSYPPGFPFGLILTATAAGLGVLRFGFSPDVIHMHQSMFCLVITLGVPFIMLNLAASSLPQFERLLESMLSTKLVLLVAFIGAVVLVSSQRNQKLTEQAGTIVLVGSVVVALVCSVWHWNSTSLAIVAIYMLTGLLGGDVDGELLGVGNVNWLHYLLCVANTLLLYV
eukprot:scpid57704/ scgid11479/ 